MKKLSKVLTLVLALTLVLGLATMASAASTTVSVEIADYAADNDWTNETKYTSLTMDSVVTVTLNGGGNTGKYYTNGNEWRVYQTEDPTITLTATGKTIVSVKITYNIKNTGVMTYNGENIASDTVVQVNASSVTFGVGNTGTATKGQVKITAIEVVYTDPGTPICQHTNATYTKTMAGHTMDCPDCEDSFTAAAHTFSNKACSVCGYELYTPAHLDKVTFYHPSSNSYMSDTFVPGTALELIVVVDGNGNYQFVTAEGKYLTSPASGGNLSFANATNSYSLWTLEETSGGWYIKNVNASYNSNSQYLELYNNTFKTYSLYSGGNAYYFMFNKTGAATEVPVFTCNHTDTNSDYLCDKDCGTVVPPAANSTLTIEQALALGTAHGTQSYTEGKYYVTGTITEVYNTTYGNMYITDGNGNTLTIYGTYSADGNTRYDSMTTKPVVGDVVTVYGVIGKHYNPQMLNGWVTDHVPHTCADNNGDHNCDTCSAELTECVDTTPKDHLCDICDNDMGEHTDTNPKDHNCDYGCSVKIGDHTVDANNDHKCDHCQAVISEHVYNSAEYVKTETGHYKTCVCGEPDTEEAHKDDNNDDKCDTCGYDVSCRHPEKSEWVAGKNETNHWIECPNCGAQDQVTPHTWTPNKDDAKHWEECTCGAEKGKADHTMVGDHNDTHHWTACACGHTTAEVKHTLVNNACDCGYEYVVPEKNAGFVSADLGLENAEDFTNKTVGDITFSASVGTNEYGNTPKYYNSGSALRFYSQNTLTIAPKKGHSIKSITITTSSDKPMTSENTKVTNGTATYGETEVVVTPSNGSKAVTLTYTATSGHWRVVSIDVTYVEGTTPSTGDSTMLIPAVVVAALSVTGMALVIKKKDF